MLILSIADSRSYTPASLSRRKDANSQQLVNNKRVYNKSIKKEGC